MKIIDLTHTIKEDMPVYPGTDAPKFRPANSYEKDGFKETLLTMFTHTGTHMDPPAHLFAGRTTLDRFPPGAVHRQGPGHRLRGPARGRGHHHGAP